MSSCPCAPFWAFTGARAADFRAPNSREATRLGNCMRTASRSLPVLFAALFAAPALAQTPRDFVTDDVYWDTLDAQGNLTGGRVQMVVPRKGSVTGVIPAPVTTLN